MVHFVDAHVGDRIRQRRLLLGITQATLAEQVGITFQQIQKYELGKNRISASKLWIVANILGVKVMYFFVGLKCSEIDPGPSIPEDVMSDRDVIAMVRAFIAIPEPQRSSILGLAKSLANAPKL